MLAAPNVHRGCETLSVFEELSKRWTHSVLTALLEHHYYPTLQTRRPRLREAESHTAFTAESGSELRPSGSRVHHENHLAPVGSVGPTSALLSALPVAGTGPSWGGGGGCSVSVCCREAR